ncbi:SWAP (Suppressor-of-White-APricot)/surpdomain-containing protein / ubiquitin family protein [Striga asiatica]|uniref:SWAP (Suppressor-of-White-APricot)/surpdomain-containing protein / ubiquitin family protein n=1 Tax=Striga asiatica TaxID=4170 RepID=A0A5A7R5N4_STRAF|nr:SWAP (Suppressor-of-White-APricot)/surpdomain-containing protein / ubiquitin family protein [Striga asiatica]
MGRKINPNEPPRLQTPEASILLSFPFSHLLPPHKQPYVHTIGPRQPQSCTDPPPGRALGTQVPDPEAGRASHHVHHLVRDHNRQPKFPGQEPQFRGYLEEDARSALQFERGVVVLASEQCRNRVDDEELNVELGDPEIEAGQHVEQVVGGGEGLDVDASEWVAGEVGRVGGQLTEAARGEWELGVEIEGGGAEAAAGGGELGGEKELEGELGLAGAALRDDLGDGLAGDAAAEEAVEEGAADGEFGRRGREGVAEELLWLLKLLESVSRRGGGGALDYSTVALVDLLHLVRHSTRIFGGEAGPRVATSAMNIK